MISTAPADYTGSYTSLSHSKLKSTPKEILWLDTRNHIDLYDNEIRVGPSISKIVQWFIVPKITRIALKDDWGYISMEVFRSTKWVPHCVNW
jgi:hypothetical protein